MLPCPQATFLKSIAPQSTGSQVKANLPFRGNEAVNVYIFGCHKLEGWEGEVILAPGKYRPKMLRNILPRTGQLPAAKDYVAKNVNDVEGEKPYHQ